MGYWHSEPAYCEKHEQVLGATHKPRPEQTMELLLIIVLQIECSHFDPA